MNIVAIVAYAAMVVEVFAAVPFAAGLLNAGTFVQSTLMVMALSYAVAAASKKVATIGERMFAGGVFLTSGHVMSEAMAGPRAAANLAMTAGKAAFRNA